MNRNENAVIRPWRLDAFKVVMNNLLWNLHWRETLHIELLPSYLNPSTYYKEKNYTHTNTNFTVKGLIRAPNELKRWFNTIKHLNEDKTHTGWVFSLSFFLSHSNLLLCHLVHWCCFSSARRHSFCNGKAELFFSFLFIVMTSRWRHLLTS